MTKFTVRFPEFLNPEQRKKILALVLGKNIAPLLVFAALPCAQAQAQVCAVGGQPCVYSVKFVCGEQPLSPIPLPPSGPVVRPGYYATTINIHNYHLDQTASIQKTAVIAIPEPSPPTTVIKSQVSNTVFVTLPPGQAFEIDCNDIVNVLFKGTVFKVPFIEGFVELRPNSATAPFPLLSVTAVYTSQQISTPEGGPVSIEVVPVQPFAGP
jgi:hypothetical protein